MIFNSIVSGGGGSETAKFTYNPDQDSGGCMLNDEPISIGDVVELQVGSINDLFSVGEQSIVTQSGFYVPYSSFGPTTRAQAPQHHYWFVMPNEDVEFRYM